MRDTVPLPVLATQTDPSPTATPMGTWPTVITWGFGFATLGANSVT